MPKRTRRDRDSEREQIGQRLEAEVAEIRFAWLKQDTEQKTREVLELLGVSDAWKRETAARLYQQMAAGELDPRVGFEQAAFVQSLTVTE
ncbi:MULTISPECIES: hypothetical protein [Streptomyces]|uniref:Uncharacterized protein n=1 Tax=Streptomyces muensis TaxID=1077944 RepID=A0A9X1Q482_STRM4|nr:MULTISPECIES: hypothetical protein [Streptomyces]MCF1597724.1 hypothetical protein [Streptomyces muensis]QKV98280.1 hypothetical protein HUT19_41935 [Streptomyces sp. NA02950]